MENVEDDVTSATVTTRLDDDCVHLSVAGKVDTGNVTTVGRLIDAAVGDMDIALAVDLSAVRAIDGGGEDLLATLAGRVREAGVELALATPTDPAPRDVVERSGLAEAATSDWPNRRAVDRADLGHHEENAERQLDPDIGEAEAEEAADMAERLQRHSQQAPASTGEVPGRP